MATVQIATIQIELKGKEALECSKCRKIQKGTVTLEICERKDDGLHFIDKIICERCTAKPRVVESNVQYDLLEVGSIWGKQLQIRPKVLNGNIQLTPAGVADLTQRLNQWKDGQ